ncbi:MAG: hypothetical protein NTW35_03180 [Candidatus Nomurabacteria bacterium]|nr:hypothetical protein [Candidatus Nomurabacteria bacterium]
MKSQKITISVSGAAEVAHCGPSVIPLAKEIGREIARQGAQIVTGATSGFPMYAAEGAKEAGGFSFGLSPAGSKKEHIEVYRLPLKALDAVVYTGFGFPGRDLMLVRSSDAVVIGCGRIGTIHEFTVAWEANMPLGVLEGEWATDEVIRNIIKEGNRENPNVIFEKDPKVLIEKLIAMVNKREESNELNIRL